MLKLTKSELIALGIVVISAVVSIALYPLMPERMASHWNLAGEVDGTMPKALALSFMPVLSAVLLALFILLPKIDPLGKNIARFRPYFDRFIVLILLFLLYVYLMMIAWNLGYRFSIGQAIIPALAVLLWFSGDMMERSERNWFIGIRTPWTLSSDRVWKETNEIGGKLMKAAGIISLLGLVFPDLGLALVAGPLFAMAIVSVVYSYVLYSKEKKRKRRK